jgi:dihydrofolate reductase
MAKLTIATFLSLDGVMQAPGGPAEDPSGGFNQGGWVVPLFDEQLGANIADIYSKVSAFLLGRTTYDIFAAHWPHVTDPSDLVAAKLNSLPKFVASHTRTGFDWSGTSLVTDVVSEVKALKIHFTGEVQVHGSCGLAQTLIQHDLIDEYHLMTFPVVLGSGRRLFGPGSVPINLQLVSSKVTSTGVHMAVYRRAGDLKTGNVVLKADGTYEMVS